jgi:hypothetical protein
MQRRQNPRADDSDDEPDLQFIADEIPGMSKRNERLAWHKIKELCMEGLAQYP